MDGLGGSVDLAAFCPSRQGSPLHLWPAGLQLGAGLSTMTSPRMTCLRKAFWGLDTNPRPHHFRLGEASRKISGCCLVTWQSVEGSGTGSFLLSTHATTREWKECVRGWERWVRGVYSSPGLVSGGKTCKLVGQVRLGRVGGRAVMDLFLPLGK